MRSLAPLCCATIIAALTPASWAAADPSRIEEVKPLPVPTGKDVFNLTLEEVRAYSAVKGFEIVGHSYLKVDGRTDWAKAKGRAGTEVGSGFNTVRVHEGIAYLAGYNRPPTVFGIVIADVRDPTNIKGLATIPCLIGTRCTYLRYDAAKKVVIFGNDPHDTNPSQPPAGEKAKSGWLFYDVSNPSKPRRLGFAPAADGIATHGMDIDGRYLYGCAAYESDMTGRGTGEGLQIIDYADPAHPVQVGAWHVPGQRTGETRGPLDGLGPDGKLQILKCHEVVYDNDRVYIAWRDAGLKIIDVKDRAHPKLIETYDYVPPFHGGSQGAAHTALPVIVKPGEPPNLLVATDEIFDCPSGTGRILDISDMHNPDVLSGKRPSNIQLLSTFRAPYVQDRFDYTTNEFVCPPQLSYVGAGYSETTHLPALDLRSPSLLYVTWYDQGLRAFDISNPYLPVEIAYFMSPSYEAPGGYEISPGKVSEGFTGRFTREVYQDPDTNLLYVTDGVGGGLTVLRYTGPIPEHPPLPGAR